MSRRSATVLQGCLAGLLAIIFLAPSVHLAVSFRDMPQLGIFHDDGIYWTSAKALAAGQGYRIASLPGLAWQTKYPPLYSTYLSLAWKIDPGFPDNLGVAASLQWLLLPLWGAVAFAFLRVCLKVKSWPAFLACGVLVLNCYSILFATTLVSEPLFCIFLTVSFIAMELAERKRSARLCSLAGVLASAAFLTRVAAVPLLLTGPLFFLMRKQYKHAAVFSGLLLASMAGWSGWGFLHRAIGPGTSANYNNYATDLQSIPIGNLFAYAAGNLATLCQSLSSAFGFGTSGSFAGQCVAYVFVAAGIAGVVRGIRRDGFGPAHLFFAAYLGLLLFWNSPPAERFVYPCWALLLGGAAIEITRVAEQVRQTAKAVAAVAFAVVISGAVLWANYAGATSSLSSMYTRARQTRASESGALDWIQHNVPPQDFVVAWDDPVVYLYTGRKAVRPPDLSHNARLSAGDVGQGLRRWADTAPPGSYALVAASDFLGGPQQLAAFQRSYLVRPGLRVAYDSPDAKVIETTGAASH